MLQEVDTYLAGSCNKVETDGVVCLFREARFMMSAETAIITGTRLNISLQQHASGNRDPIPRPENVIQLALGKGARSKAVMHLTESDVLGLSTKSKTRQALLNLVPDLSRTLA